MNVNNLFDQYCDLVVKANNKLNLVSRTSVEKVIRQLVAESLYALDWDLCRIRTPMLDIGSGAGIPGIPIKLARPELCLILLEAKRRKSLFLKNTSMMLALTDTDSVHGRAEELGSDPVYVGHFNTVVTRGVTTLGKLMKWSHPLLKPKGELIAWKGSSVNEDLTSLDTTGWSDPELKRFKGGLTLVRFEKE